MMSYSSGEGGPPLLRLTIGEVLSRSTANHPGNDALVVCHQGVRLNYAELDKKVKRVAKGLLAYLYSYI